MRILQVNKFYDPRGGTERGLFDLEYVLRLRGDEVGVFAGAHPLWTAAMAGWSVSDDRNRPAAAKAESTSSSPSIAEARMPRSRLRRFSSCAS